MTKAKTTSPGRIAYGRPTAIARALSGAATPALAKFGFKRHEILTRWPLIVGAPLAATTRPERILPAAGGATLVIRVDGAAGLEIQHLAPQIIERVNTFLGGAPVARLRLIQGTIPSVPVPPPRSERPLTEAEQKALAAAAGNVSDAELRESLVALGRRILLRKAPGPTLPN